VLGDVQRLRRTVLAPDSWLRWLRMGEAVILRQHAGQVHVLLPHRRDRSQLWRDSCDEVFNCILGVAPDLQAVIGVATNLARLHAVTSAGRSLGMEAMTFLATTGCEFALLVDWFGRRYSGGCKNSPCRVLTPLAISRRAKVQSF